jgi:serine/threonine-protein kinase
MSGEHTTAVAQRYLDELGGDSPSRLFLAMALYRDGQLAEARNTLAAAIQSYDWRETRAREPIAWTCHVMRREAEGLILPNPTAFRR